MTSFRYLSLFATALCFSTTMAQSYTQTVRGTVVDSDTREPLIGATVVVTGTVPQIGNTTGLDGRFTLDKVPVGRIDLQVRMMGYEEQVLANLLVNSAKELVLDVRMQESLEQLKEAVVTGQKSHGEVRNDMATLSARKISVEETSRMAGGINDPARMVTSFPGVAGDPTGNNTVVVRGNSPKGVLWRLEGIEIPNPNHFTDDGTTGGPINALNSDMIDNSDFYTGAFAAEYGNVTSAVFDMKLRDGNDNKREYTFKLGVLGIDLTAEGPLPGPAGGSYLANFRYARGSLRQAIVGQGRDRRFAVLRHGLRLAHGRDRPYPHTPGGRQQLLVHHGIDQRQRYPYRPSRDRSARRCAAGTALQGRYGPVDLAIVKHAEHAHQRGAQAALRGDRHVGQFQDDVR